MNKYPIYTASRKYGHKDFERLYDFIFPKIDLGGEGSYNESNTFDHIYSDTPTKHYAMSSNLTDLIIYVPICGVSGTPRVDIDTQEGKLAVTFDGCEIDNKNPFAPSSPIEIPIPSIRVDYSEAKKTVELGTLIVKIPHSKKETKRIVVV